MCVLDDAPYLFVKNYNIMYVFIECFVPHYDEDPKQRIVVFASQGITRLSENVLIIKIDEVSGARS